MEHDTTIQEQFISVTHLLSLKRYELPPQEYFDNFLAQLHERLIMEDSPNEGPAGIS